MIHSNKTIAIPPGATIREQLENREISQKEFAQRMGLSEKHISHLINGKVELTQDVALRLESVLGVPARFWINLESLYREQIARVDAELAMEDEEKIVSKTPYAEIASLGWVPKTRKPKEKVVNLRSFFEVAKLVLLQNIEIPGIAYRVNGGSFENNYVLAVWAQKARLEARKQEVGKISIDRVKENVQTIRQLTVLDPEVFCKELRIILSNCGISIVFLPHIKGSYLHGATFVDGNHIVLGLTVRGRDADKFWFSLFHELYHIIEGHIFDSVNTTGEQEKAADKFASDVLIRPEDFIFFKDVSDFSKGAIIAFSKKIHIAPGILLGRLQKEKLVPYDRYQELKEKYIIS